MPVNAAKGTVHLVARWSGCLIEEVKRAGVNREAGGG
jgi:hypothetical protein